MTTARYYTPSGRVIQENGILPDITVEMPIADEAKDKEKDESDSEKKVQSEKDRMRKFLREADLKKHLKGKKSEDSLVEDEASKKDLDEEQRKRLLTALDEELEKDAQLRHAISLLAGWEVMSSSLKTFGGGVKAKQQ